MTQFFDDMDMSMLVPLDAAMVDEALSGSNRSVSELLMLYFACLTNTNDEIAIIEAPERIALAISDMADDGDAVVLDVRDRAAYRIDHYAQAINMPADDLGIRGPVEISAFGRVFVDCRVGHLGDCRQAARWMVLDGFREVVVVVP